MPCSNGSPCGVSLISSDAWEVLSRLYERPALKCIDLRSDIYDPRYAQWRSATRKLLRTVDVEQPRWRNLAVEADKLSFVIHNSPIPPSHAFCVEWLSKETREDSYKQIISPVAKEALDSFWAASTVLRSCENSPMFQWLFDTFTELSEGDDDERTLLVLKEDWVRPVRKMLNRVPGLRGLQVMDTAVLADPVPLQTVYVCGALVLYPPSLYTCGRATGVCWAIFDWMKPELPDLGPGLYDEKRVGPRLIVTGIGPPQEGEPTPTEFEPSGLWEVCDRTPGVDHNSDDVDEHELVDAVLLELAQGSRTYAPMDEKVSVAMAMDSGTPGSIHLTRRFGKDLVEDDFVILRSYGESDVILELANKVLRGDAATLRQSQADWKQGLSEVLRGTSLDSVVLELRRLGSPIADPQNVRNWVSPRHIRTQNRRDFDAIMRLIGREDESQAVWNQMARIFRAHIRAGMDLKRQLASGLRCYSGHQLDAAGRLDVEVPGLDAGQLSAIRIERVVDYVEVRASDLLHEVLPWQ